MGEAKRRKATDPNYGKNRCGEFDSSSIGGRGGANPGHVNAVKSLPPGGRGLVVAPKIRAINDRLIIDSSGIDPHELRLATLFWDRLVWPQNSIVGIEGGCDEKFLEQEGFIDRPVYSFAEFNSGEVIDMARLMKKSYAQAFSDADVVNPGAWAFSHQANSFVIDDEIVGNGKSVVVKLFNCIPVPDRDVPLAEVLEFKARRNDELLALRCEIEDLYQTICSSSDEDFSLLRAQEKIRSASLGAIAVSKEAHFKFRMTDVFASFAPPAFEKLICHSLGDEVTAAALAGSGAAAFLALSIVHRLGRVADRRTPYRYVSRFHEELF